MAYQSGEFSIPGVGNRPVPQALAYFNQRLWLIGRGNAWGEMWQTTLTVEKGGATTIDLQGGAAASASNWTTSWLQIPDAPGGPRTSSRCAATPLGDALYLFWSNLPRYSGCTLMASRYTDVGEGALKWSSALTLQDTHGETLHPMGSSNVAGYALEAAGVAATPFNTNTIIVASSNVPNPSEGGSGVYIGAFDVNDINQQDNTWKARREFWLPLNLHAQTVPWIEDLNVEISIDWFNSSDGPEGDPPFWLWVSLSLAAGASGGRATFFLPLDTGGNPSPIPSDIYTDFLPFGCFVVRDPAGRVRTYFDESISSTLIMYSYNTYQAIQKDWNLPPLPFVRETLPTKSNDGFTPSVAFFTDMNGGQPFTLHGRDGTQYPVYEFIVYPASSMKCQVNLYGYAQVLKDYASLTPTPKNKDTFIIRGIVDGPIPVPEANFAGVAWESTQPDFGVVTYSATEEHKAEHTVSNSFTLGAKTQGGVSKGVGVGWDIAVSGGPAWINGTVNTTSYATDRSQHSLLDTGEGLPKPTMIPDGALFCTDAVIYATAYRFVDANGTPISDSTSDGTNAQAPLFVSTRTIFSDARSRSYLPYAVTPGDLKSYQPDVLNARMKALSRPGDPYVGERYFEEVIIPNAYKFKDGKNYLAFEWSKDSSATTAFQATNNTFTEYAWTFDASIYVGVSGGWDVNIIGLGSAGSFNFLAGGTYSHSANWTDTATTGWGIGIEKGTEGRIGPPYVDGPKADPARVISYTFRLYYLPPPAPQPPGSQFPSLKPNYWVQELRTCLGRVPQPAALPYKPEDIDPNAAAWKLVYVVTSWETAHDQYTYPT